MDMPKDYSLIKKVLDKYFNFLKELGPYSFAFMTEFIPEAMLDKTKEHDDEGYSWWIPTPSTVTDKNISELEALFGHPLPGSFKYFLQQRHFIELDLGGYDIRFFPNRPGELAAVFKEKIVGYYGELAGRNYLPFADFNDFGVLCFDANKKVVDNEYALVMLDHEDGYERPEFYAKDFTHMFFEFDANLDEWMKNWAEKKAEGKK